MPAKTGLDALLRPEDSILVLIDHQPYQFTNLNSHEPTMIVNNVIGLAKTAKVFNVPTILTTVIEERGGYLIKGLQDVFPEQKPIDRTFINTWEDPKVVDIVKKSGRKQLVLAALYTEICLAMPAIQALAEGYDVFIVTDASGGVSLEAHDMAVRRMVAAGAVPITWLAVLGEWQRDWAREKTAAGVAGVVLEHGGASGCRLGLGTAASRRTRTPAAEVPDMPTAPAPIRIGYCLSLTGPVAGNSRSARLAHDIWREDINSRGGLLGRPVELICYDDHADASRVPGLYKRLMDEDKVDLVIGGYGTNSHLAGDAVDHGAAALFRRIDGPRRQQRARLSELLRHDSNRAGSERRAHRRILRSRRGAKAAAHDRGARVGGRRILAQSHSRRKGQCREVRLSDRPRGHLSADDRGFQARHRRRRQERLRPAVSLLLPR